MQNDDPENRLQRLSDAATQCGKRYIGDKYICLYLVSDRVPDSFQTLTMATPVKQCTKIHEHMYITCRIMIPKTACRYWVMRPLDVQNSTLQTSTYDLAS